MPVFSELQDPEKLRVAESLPAQVGSRAAGMMSEHIIEQEVVESHARKRAMSTDHLQKWTLE